MRNIMRATLLAGMLLAGGSVLAAQVSIGISIGPPPPPRVVYAVPVSPGPDFIWIEGYWYPAGRRYKWHGGYWTRAPYAGARWVVPRYDGGQFFEGYWEGDRGRFGHDHRWDRDRRNRDFRWSQDHDRDQGRDRDRDRDRQ